jgi:hypothetical protein
MLREMPYATTRRRLLLYLADQTSVAERANFHYDLKSVVCSDRERATQLVRQNCAAGPQCILQSGRRFHAMIVQRDRARMVVRRSHRRSKRRLWCPPSWSRFSLASALGLHRDRAQRVHRIRGQLLRTSRIRRADRDTVDPSTFVLRRCPRGALARAWPTLFPPPPRP